MNNQMMSYSRNNLEITLDDLGLCYQLSVSGLFASTLKLTFRDYVDASASFDRWVEIGGISA